MSLWRMTIDIVCDTCYNLIERGRELKLWHNVYVWSYYYEYEAESIFGVMTALRKSMTINTLARRVTGTLRFARRF